MQFTSNNVFNYRYLYWFYDNTFNNIKETKFSDNTYLQFLVDFNFTIIFKFYLHKKCPK